MRKVTPSACSFTAETEKIPAPKDEPQSEGRNCLIPSLEFLLKWNTVFSQSLLLQSLHFIADIEITILF